MIFLTGWALWLLGLGAVVGIVYFLKRQAQVVPVSALFLWRGIAQNPKSSLRVHWAQLLGLLLQLLALVALIMGIAQPVIHTSASGDQTLAIIMDGSASMRFHIAAQGPTRYEKAIDSTLQLLRENPAARVTVIQAQTQSVLISPSTHDHAQIQREISGSKPTYQGDSPVSELISLLQSQSTNGFDRVVYFTDHNPSADVQALGWEVHIAEEADSQNLGITRFAAREHPNQSGYDLYLEVWNSTDELQNIPLEITADGLPLDERFLELAPHQASSLTFNYEGAPPSRFAAHLRVDTLRDDWPDDNLRYASLPQPRPWKILWIGEGDFYLERFLRLSGQADLTVMSSWDAAASADDYDVILLHRASLPKAMSGRFLLIESEWAPWVTLGESFSAPDQEVVEAKSNLPLLAGLDPKDWRLLQVQETHTDPHGDVLLALGETPLLYTFDTAGLRLVYLGIDLGASNLGLTVDFPILMYRLLSWLAPREEENRDEEIGQVLPLIDFEGSVRVANPEGQTCQFPSEDTHCGLTEQPGFYEVLHNGTTQVYAANPPSQESKFEPSPPERTHESLVPTARVSPGAAAAESGFARRLWPYLLSAGVLLLILELFYFDRSFRPFSRTRERRAKS